MSDESSPGVLAFLKEWLPIIGGGGGLISLIVTGFVWGTAWSDIKHQVKDQGDRLAKLQAKVDHMNPPLTAVEIRCNKLLDTLASEAIKDISKTLEIRDMVERLNCIPKRP